MTVTSLAQSTQGTAAPSPQKAASGAAALASDFNTFIRLLTAQARYQDPLEPLDSSQYASQLAQFSMVEQQVLANDRLASLNASLATGNMAALANWIGMDARAPSAVEWSGRPIEIAGQVTPGADAAAIVFRNASGLEIARQSFPTGGNPIVWDGRDESGSVLPFGTYSATIESRASGAVIGEAPALIYARVVEAQVKDGQTLLVLSGGATVPADQVTALRPGQGR